MGSGRRVSLGQEKGPVGPVVNGALGDGNLQDRALGVGDTRSQRKSVGKRNAVYAKRALTGASGSEFIIGHDLGEVASTVSISEQGPRGYAGILRCKAVRKETWTHSTVRVIVETSGANLNGSYAVFEVSGR